MTTAFDAPRLCSLCGQPLPPGAHGNVRLHKRCRRHAKMVRDHLYYAMHANELQTRRRQRYRQQRKPPAES